MERVKISAQILRFDPETETKPRFETYKLPFNKGATVLGILRYIYEHMDRTLAFRNYHCAAQVCGGCKVKVNGRVVKACNKRVGPGEMLIIEPVNRKKLIRDLVVASE